MRTQPDRSLARALYEKVIAGELRLADVARRAGMSGAKLYSLCEGTRHVLAADLPALYRATEDLELLSALIGADDCGLVVVKRKDAAEMLTEDCRSGALRVSAKAGELAALVDEIVADGVVTGVEHDAAEKTLDALERAAEAVRVMLKARGPIRRVG